MRKPFGLMALVAWTLAGCASKEQVSEVPAMIEAGALVVDVRTAGEFSSGHIEGAIQIPYETIVEAFAERKVPLDEAVVVYCRSGHRAGIAKRMLQDAGYTHVENGGSLNKMRKLLGR